MEEAKGTVNDGDACSSSSGIRLNGHPLLFRRGRSGMSTRSGDACYPARACMR